MPRVAYNNNDEAGGSPFGIIGTQVGTEIKSDDAYSFTTGIRLSIPLQ